ncbi:AAA family ATPase [Bradyrhizobium sp.]|uniref:bifunctional aminoglycoside phosphotransferase/ATP-binding protein n=1 Tax=Bradyrhizobium sp. TaxID=376 RepID=UPI003C716977
MNHDRTSSSRETDQSAVLRFLADAEPGAQRIDTHASIVFLGKERVLKIKRAVRLPFLDYSTPDKRRRACEEELKVNIPFAPRLYRRVVPITHGKAGLAIDGTGIPVEWAVEMARFDETRSLDRIAAAAEIPPTLAASLADAIDDAHHKAAPAQGISWLNSIAEIIDRNTARFRSARGLSGDAVDRLDALSHAAHGAQASLLAARADAGWVRHCHGDLHLGNIVLIDDKPVLFDAIEFDPVIATTDILYDLAFPLMDLFRFGQAAAANALFNRYFGMANEANRNALALLPLFLSMRAAIRAHVLFTKSEQSEDDTSAWNEAKRYFDLAVRLIDPEPPCMVAVGGLSGTGKSVASRAIAPLLGPPPGALILRSDVIRKARFGVAETTHLPPSAYEPAVTGLVYQALMDHARHTAEQGCSVVLDSAFLRGTERAAFAATPPAAVRHIGLFLEADRPTRLARIEARRKDASDASDATAAVAVVQEAMTEGDLDWPRIDANGTPAETLARCMPYLPTINAADT